MKSGQMTLMVWQILMLVDYRRPTARKKVSWRFFFHQLFTPGLKDELRSKIMEAGMETLQESLFLARELEVIVQDKKKATLDTVVEEEDTLGEEDIEVINAIRFQRGQKPFRRWVRNFHIHFM